MTEQVKAAQKDVAAGRKACSSLRAQNAAVSKENAALRKEMEALKRLRADGRTDETLASRAGQNSSPDNSNTVTAEGLIAALDELRQIDPNMRISTAISFLLVPTHGGVSAARLAEHVGDTTEGSMRYSMRALGPGWPGKRVGHGLILDCADPEDGRKRLYFVSSRGRAVRDAVLSALLRADTRSRSDRKLAA